jgi:phage terminase large subunit-like protein
MANDARRMPSRENEYRNLILNQRVEAHSPFISKSVWQSCGADTLPFESDTRLFGGLDLSSTNDLTALVLVGKPKDAKAWHVHPTFWLPAEGIHERSRNDRVSYDVWARNGFLHTVPGKSIEYEYVAEYIAGILDRYTVSAIAFDRWMFKQFRPWLLKAGIEERKIEKTFIEAGQGFQWMSPALRETESALLNQRIAHGNHPVLTWNANNAVVISDPAGNRKLAKNRSTGRIDGMVALAMAIGVTATQLEAPEPAYQMFSL